MMSKAFVVSALAALVIALSGAVSAEPKEGLMPSSVQDPVSDPEKQAKTEEMLKGAEKGITGDQGGLMPSKVEKATSDPEAQAKTEQMLKEEQGALQGK